MLVKIQYFTTAQIFKFCRKLGRRLKKKKKNSARIRITNTLRDGILWQVYWPKIGEVNDRVYVKQGRKITWTPFCRILCWVSDPDPGLVGSRSGFCRIQIRVFRIQILKEIFTEWYYFGGQRFRSDPFRFFNLVQIRLSQEGIWVRIRIHLGGGVGSVYETHPVCIILIS